MKAKIILTDDNTENLLSTNIICSVYSPIYGKRFTELWTATIPKLRKEATSDDYLKLYSEITNLISSSFKIISKDIDYFRRHKKEKEQ